MNRRLALLPSTSRTRRADETEIGWTHAKGYVGRTWNPVTGCRKVSPGCKHCYAETFAERFRGVVQPNGSPHPFHNGFEPTLRPQRVDEPRSWRKPSVVFVNSMSDLFGEFVPDDYLDRLFETMRETPQHVYQILTKRPERLVEYSSRNPWLTHAKNIWLGVSVEDRKFGLPRVELLRQATASVRFLSVEPLLEALGDIDLSGVDWVIVGGESGRKARPMNADWVREVRDQCVAARIPFFLKQWGEFDENGVRKHKKHAGRTLDGRTWDEFPCGLVADDAVASPVEQKGEDHGADDEVFVSHEDHKDEDGVNRETGDPDPYDGRVAEEELDGLVLRLTDDMSALAVVKLLPRAKAIYERLHPETRHGGSREDQVASLATWPSFARYVAGRTGLSERTIYNRLETADDLQALDADAEAACYGTPLANKLSLLGRIALLPDVAAQRDIVAIYRASGPQNAKRELVKYEEKFNLVSGSRPELTAEPETEPPSESTEPTEVEESVGGINGQPELVEHQRFVADIVECLGVSQPLDCIAKIQNLKSLAAEAQELRARLVEVEAKNRELQQKLSTFHSGPFDQVRESEGAPSASPSR